MGMISKLCDGRVKKRREFGKKFFFFFWIGSETRFLEFELFLVESVLVTLITIVICLSNIQNEIRKSIVIYIFSALSTLE